ncbi:MAG TPA: acetyl-CoA C-acyltransferase [Polyangiales bacterium]|nr:acetyl-CoA C-acyltransferase [Polyangiales bacterium]
MSNKQDRAVIVGGLRTPFAKAFGELMELDTIALGVAATGALLRKLSLDHKQIDGVVWSGVVLPPLSVNIGREIVLDLGLPTSIEATTVTRACTSSLAAITIAASAIERGDADVMIAGGSDSTSNAPIAFPTKVTRTLAPLALSGKATPHDVLGALSQLIPLSEVLPRQPRVAERTTGEVMGESAERMAQRNEISRQHQDEFALRSHKRAARAIATGRFDDETTKVQTPHGFVHVDTLVRADTSIEKLAKLKPVFAKNGTITAGSSSALTDGAAAVVLMRESKARALGYTPLAAFRSWSYVAVDPADQLLLGPAIAVPKALDRAGLRLADIDLVDMHEAFAAQVLSVLKMLGSRAFARERLGRDAAIGDIDPERLNVYGGSIAIGHPFAATGARIVTTMANELHRTDKRTALIGICAAGGLGAAAVLEKI